MLLVLVFTGMPVSKNSFLAPVPGAYCIYILERPKVPEKPGCWLFANRYSPFRGAGASETVVATWPGWYRINSANSGDTILALHPILNSAVLILVTSGVVFAVLYIWFRSRIKAPDS
ncbi:MAG: hypothetical protein K1X75_17545 [Leptospirales bacterium]|nr:hypothetical protein [Leptospirales bacterium]